MDRNHAADISARREARSLSARRVWIEISFNPQQWHLAQQSLSARRVWIEIASSRRVPGRALVALRKESVDRNYPPVKPVKIGKKSLSARRVWIEIIDDFEPSTARRCRSPQGECG